jgi:RNA polymerase sigma-70 factor, ECF subfamily
VLEVSSWTAAHAEAERAWQGVQLDYAVFERHLRDLGCTDELPAHVSEVYLACACVHGDATAGQYFQTRYVCHLRDAVARVFHDDGAIDEITRDVCHKLFVGPPPRLCAYTGRGALDAWLRVVAGRAALDRARADRRRGRELTPVHDELPNSGSGMESRLDRARYQAIFQEATARAIDALSLRDRNVLRLHFRAGLGIEAIAQAYGVHRATATRWVARIRSVLMKTVRVDLRRQVGQLTNSEFRGLVRLLRSQLEIVISSWADEARPASAEQTADGAPKSA